MCEHLIQALRSDAGAEPPAPRVSEDFTLKNCPVHTILPCCLQPTRAVDVSPGSACPTVGAILMVALSVSPRPVSQLQGSGGWL